MLEQIRCHLACRVLAALALLPLFGCSEHHTLRAGYFELSSTSPGAACDVAPQGELRLQALGAPAFVLVSGAELCSGALVRRELPPGPYSLSWQNAAYEDLFGSHEPELLRGPAVVSLFSGQLTRLRVQLEAAPAAVASSVRPSRDVGVQRRAPPSACNGGPGGAGAS